jgi:lipid II:glycine glycyltransferase (peptidoglycan interpeptide bridge formation enzyme)
VEIYVVRLGNKPIAAGILTHGSGVTEIPSASSLRQYNSTCANMLLYWNVLLRALERGQSTFDFGRSSPDSPTYKFKEQWGAKPALAVWHYHMRSGDISDMRPDNHRNQRLIRIWKRLPVPLTRLIGPQIVRGIP